MKNIKKEIVCVVLVIVLIVTGSTFGFASSSNDSISIEEAINRAKVLYPNAYIYVDDNGTISIVMDAMFTSKNSIQNRSSIYAPNGGSYRNFTVPIWWDASSGIPYSIVYLPEVQINSIIQAKLNTDVFEFIIDHAAYSIDMLQNVILATFGVSISQAALLFLIGFKTYNALDWMDTQALMRVTANYQKIEIVRSSLYGYPSNMYFGWTGNYVDASPYEDFNPSFYSGVYDL